MAARELGPILRRVGLGAALVGGTTTAASAVGSLAAAAYVARSVLTPEQERPDDTALHEVRRDTVVLGATPATVAPGRYGLWFAGGSGHARVGAVVAGGMADGMVEREVVAVDRGRLAPGGALWSATWFIGTPSRALGLTTRHVAVESELGPMAAWVVPGAARDRWAVLVHGRGATREEALRAIPTLHREGWTCLVPSYRNDRGVPAGPDGRYNLGLSEWRDIEAAVLYAVQHGARDVTMVGWSMGGAITLQFLDRSWLSSVVSRVVLDGGVVDWGDVLGYHVRVNRIPAPVGTLARSMMGRRWGKRLVGVHESVDVARTDWVSRHDELRHPMLLVHSVDDDVVPVGPSRRLAQARPDLVTLEEWEGAKHCTEWNTDTERWERVVGAFVRA